MTRYQGPVVDAHHHFWQPLQGNLPWLLPEARIPFRYGPYDSLKRDYLPPDLLSDARGINLVGTVTMETEWNLDDPIGEMDYVAGIAAEYGLPTAAVAHAVLRATDVESTLEQLSERPLVRAVREKPGGATDASGLATNPSLMTDAQWQRGYALLSHYGLDFELQTSWWHLPEAAMLAARFPLTHITINHAGLPADRSEGGLAAWAKGLRTMARFDNVAMKISGIGLQGEPWTVQNNRRIVETVAGIFGIDRIMFASNFPVDRLTATYREIYEGFEEITASWSYTEQWSAFCGNAIKFYRLPEDLGATRKESVRS